MEKNPRKTKAFIITFIAVFLLLLLAYFLFMRGGGGAFTKSILSIQKSFFPLKNAPGDKVINVATNGDGSTGRIDSGSNSGSGSGFTGTGSGSGSGFGSGSGSGVGSGTGGGSSGSGAGTGGIGSGTGAGINGSGTGTGGTGSGSGSGFGSGSGSGTGSGSGSGSSGGGTGGGTGGDDSSPQCSDGVDNDGKNGKDASDPGCWTNRNDSSTYDANDSVEYDVGGGDYIDACTLLLMKEKLITNQADIDRLEIKAIADYNNSFIIPAGTRGIWPKVLKGGGGAGPIGTGVSTITECNDGADNDANGLKDKSDPSCHTDGDKYNVSSYDNKITKELNPPISPTPVPDCFDTIDNDRNGKKDSEDPGCWTNMTNKLTYQPSDNYEFLEITECNDGVDNDGNKVKDAGDPACWTDQKVASSYNPSSPYENLVGSITLPHIPYTKITVAVQTKNGVLNIPIILFGILPGNILPITPEQISTYLNTMGYDKQAVDSTGKACLPPPKPPQCNDWMDTNGNGRQDAGDTGDNDGDGLIDRADPGCHQNNDPIKPWDKTRNNEFNTKPPVPQCNDGIDNDGKNGKDASDPGCWTDRTNSATYDKNDSFEHDFAPQCSDGADNDGDTFIDEDDLGCHSDLNPNNAMSYTPNKTSELGFIPQCRNGKDDDGDNLKDENDPGCHTDLNPTNSSTYDPDGYLEFNLIPECSDNVDNDKNKLIDWEDPGCYTDLKITKKTVAGKIVIDTTNYDPHKTLEFKFLTQCEDGVDNDGKNGKDASDPGCWTDVTDPHTYNPEDTFEYQVKTVDPNASKKYTECNDGIDNDKDGLTDAYDPECSEDYVPKVPECNDGVDNDNDLWIDGIDPSCLLYLGNPRGNTQDVWQKDRLYEDPKNAKKYNPEHASEGSVFAEPIIEKDVASCIDVPFEFTDEEIRQLDDLTREFNLIAPNLKTDADILTEQDKKRQYDDLVAQSNKLTKQCVEQKRLSSVVNPYNPSKPAGPTNDPNKPSDWTIPLEMLPNPYQNSPGYLAALHYDKVKDNLGKDKEETDKKLDNYLLSVAKTLNNQFTSQRDGKLDSTASKIMGELKFYLPSYSYIHSDALFGLQTDELSKVDNNGIYGNDTIFYHLKDSGLTEDKNHFLFQIYKNGVPRPECSDGKDNDSDGFSDEYDPGCWYNTYNPADTYHDHPFPTFNKEGVESTVSAVQPVITGVNDGIPKQWRNYVYGRTGAGIDRSTANHHCLKNGLVDNKSDKNCFNQPIYGVYDIKDIVDLAYVDYMQNRTTHATMSNGKFNHLLGYLAPSDLFPSIKISQSYTTSIFENWTHKDYFDIAIKMVVQSMAPVIGAELNRETVSYFDNNATGSISDPPHEIPSKVQAASGDYNYKDIGIWGIVNMYAGEAYNNTYALGGNKKAQTLVEPQFAYFCNWVPNTNRDGSPSADNEDTQAIINHSDPRQRNVIACAFLKGLLSNWKDIGKMDIRELKRQVDDVVYKLLPATPEDEIYWGEATPLQDFEKTYSIW